MKLFECPICSQRLYFENTRCEQCGCTLGYVPERADLTALGAMGGSLWRALDDKGGKFRFCNNAAWDACNWLIEADEPGDYCRACRLNRTVPDLSDIDNLMRWRVLERAKHRLVYSILALKLPLVDRFTDPAHGLAFDFLAGSRDDGADLAQIGHANGVITIAVEEADDVHREVNRNELSEPYRTVLGHFRHEVGHYYWDRLVTPGVLRDTFRNLFGDERRSYSDALAAHYTDGPPENWRANHVSSYASAHPWEDFAETWAHYLHIVDTVETASYFGMRLDPDAGRELDGDAATRFASVDATDFDALIAAWVSLTYALNCLSLSMGQRELYPFVLAPAALGKMRFVHGLIHAPPQAGSGFIAQ
jgi:hypothetical protein